MNTAYQIVTDSSCDLPGSLADTLGLVVVPLQFTIDDVTYLNESGGGSPDAHTFYEALRAGKHAATAAANPSQFLEKMEPVLGAGKDLLYIGFSSGLSTTYQSGCIAAQELREKYPERTILTLDSLCASLGQGLFVWLAAKRQQAGASLQELYDALLALRPRLCHWFTVDDLLYLKRGGRISAATAVVGTVLQIKPIMHMDDAGHLASVSKARGRRAALHALAEKVCREAAAPETQTVFICHGDCREDAEEVARQIRAGSPVREFVIHDVGPVIGAHTGPGVVSVFYVGEHR